MIVTILIISLKLSSKCSYLGYHCACYPYKFFVCVRITLFGWIILVDMVKNSRRT